MNHYGYCWGNLVGFADRDGNLPTIVIGAAVGFAAGGLGEIAGQVVSGIAEGKSLKDAVKNVDIGKAVLEAGKGAVVGSVAGSGAGLLVVAGTAGLVDGFGDVADQKYIQKKSDIDVSHAMSAGIWFFGTTLALGFVGNTVSNALHPDAMVGSMDYLLGRDAAISVVEKQLEVSTLNGCKSAQAKYAARLARIIAQRKRGIAIYGMVEIIKSIKDSIIYNRIDDDMTDSIDNGISCVLE